MNWKLGRRAVKAHGLPGPVVEEMGLGEEQAKDKTDKKGSTLDGS